MHTVYIKRFTYARVKCLSINISPRLTSRAHTHIIRKTQPFLILRLRGLIFSICLMQINRALGHIKVMSGNEKWWSIIRSRSSAAHLGSISLWSRCCERHSSAWICNHLIFINDGATERETVRVAVAALPQRFCGYSLRNLFRPMDGAKKKRSSYNYLTKSITGKKTRLEGGWTHTHHSNKFRRGTRRASCPRFLPLEW